jgi:hypothetical protein
MHTKIAPPTVSKSSAPPALGNALGHASGGVGDDADSERVELGEERRAAATTSGNPVTGVEVGDREHHREVA